MFNLIYIMIYKIGVINLHIILYNNINIIQVIIDRFISKNSWNQI